MFHSSKGPYLFDKTYAYSLVLRGLTNTLTTYKMYYHMHILLLFIELLFLTLYEVLLGCLFQVPLYNYFNNSDNILMETSVSRKITILCIMFKIIAFYLFARVYWLAFCAHVGNTCITTEFLEKWGFGSMKLV